MFRPTSKLIRQPCVLFPIDTERFAPDTCMLTYEVYDEYIALYVMLEYTNLFEFYTKLIRVVPLPMMRKHFENMIKLLHSDAGFGEISMYWDREQRPYFELIKSIIRPYRRRLRSYPVNLLWLLVTVNNSNEMSLDFVYPMVSYLGLLNK